MSTGSHWLTVLFKTTISLLILCLLVVSVIEREVLKFLNCGYVYFSLQFYDFLLHVF